MFLSLMDCAFSLLWGSSQMKPLHARVSFGLSGQAAAGKLTLAAADHLPLARQAWFQIKTGNPQERGA
jgi:hypothetical protein